MAQNREHHHHDRPDIDPYKGPAGGWGSLRGVAEVWADDAPIPARVISELARQNKVDGFMCVSCAWAKPAHPHPAEFCEEGAKATIWELTKRRCTPDFFAHHTVSELLDWNDHDLESAGRLTDPLRYDRAADRYVPCGWDEALGAIAAELKAIDPRQAVFYTSGRASLEASYMYALMARMYGSQNLPDSSNMCHESTSVGLKQSLGVGVGTVTLEDFEETDCILFFGQNVGVNSPRMLHDLEACSKRGVPIVTFNPLRERGLERFKNPQSPVEMLGPHETRISSQYLPVKAGGDIAAITGLCKWLIENDGPFNPTLDRPFIADHTQGFEPFEAFCRSISWEDIERESGLAREQLEAAGRTYAGARACIAVYGMGLTQHRLGVQNVRILCNLLLLRGNIGKPGAGACPVRGHSNVQGQRTVGITEKPELAPLNKLRALYGFEPPRQKGLNTVEACEGLLKGEVKAFFGLGGNFVRAIPDTERMEAAWRRQRLTVQVATKLNRSHLICGEIAYLLPCNGRTERDQQASGPQIVSTEDSTGCIHASYGRVDPASDNLRSEAAIIAGVARRLLPPNPKVPWEAWTADYAKVRDAIAATYAKDFHDFNDRFHTPGGFRRHNPAAERDFSAVPGGKAAFMVPPALSATGFKDEDGVLRLVTVRSNDQFNTTIYGYDDRFRGIKGTREVLMMCAADMRRHGLADGDEVGLECAQDDGVRREKHGLRVVAYDIPEGCVAGYYPELNRLIPLGHHAEESKVPAGKAVPVRILAKARAQREERSFAPSPPA
ncbi:MAG TPA: FdhF/YdeP family oxidoreductase [Caulobacteraceae bacterium]|jgi:molybdopterin-dependent oxidoreductase alpha subunit